MFYFLLGIVFQLGLFSLFNHGIDAFVFGSLLVCCMGIHLGLGHFNKLRKQRAKVESKPKPVSPIIKPVVVKKAIKPQSKKQPDLSQQNKAMFSVQFGDTGFALNRKS